MLMKSKLWDKFGTVDVNALVLDPSAALTHNNLTTSLGN